ncbi:hypothetical protein Aperf_G00000005806 [Anoplocephala perfoliata]
MSPAFSNRLLILMVIYIRETYNIQHKNRDIARSLETESIKETRIKASLDHLEMNIGDGRMDSIKTSTGKKNLYTLRSTPEKINPTLLGYFVNGECHLVQLKNDFLVMDNVKEPIKVSEFLEGPVSSRNRNSASTSIEKPSVITARMRSEADRIAPVGAEQTRKQTLEEMVRNLLVKVQVIKFEKLMDYLRERSSDKGQVTPTAVIACLNKCAVLVKGWWAIRSDILYPPNTFSEHAAVPSAQLIRARDYVMGVFHRGGHLTRKTVSSVTKLPSLEVTEILESLGNRIFSGTEGHNNHWEFRQPDVTFIRSHPAVVYQHAENWESRIRQLCSQLKLHDLVIDAIQSRRRCSGHLSRSDADDNQSSLSSPRTRRRCRLLSCSPERQKRSASSSICPPAAKRARTKSASVSNDQIAAPASASTGEMSLPPPSMPLASVNVDSPRKSSGSNTASRPTPPLFNSSRSASPPSLPPVPPPKRFPQHPNSPSPSAQKGANSSVPLMVTADTTTDILKQEPRSPGCQHLETESPPEQAPRMPKIPIKNRIGVSEKIEEPDQTEPNHEYSMVEDPSILTFVKEKLRTLPILALSELTKACQPFLASLHTKTMSKNGSAPPPGSEAERTVLSSELYKVVLAVGGRELKIIWPKVTWALPKQPLFVAPMTVEFGDPGSPHIRVREAILERLEENQFITFGSIKQELIKSGLKISDNNLRTTIKRYCIYRQSKYFLRYTVDEKP